MSNIVIIVAAVWCIAGLFANERAGLRLLVHLLTLCVLGPIAHFITQQVASINILGITYWPNKSPLALMTISAGGAKGVAYLVPVMDDLVEQAAEDCGVSPQEFAALARIEDGDDDAEV